MIKRPFLLRTLSTAFLFEEGMDRKKVGPLMINSVVAMKHTENTDQSAKVAVSFS